MNATTNSSPIVTVTFEFPDEPKIQVPLAWSIFKEEAPRLAELVETAREEFSL